MKASSVESGLKDPEGGLGASHAGKLHEEAGHGAEEAHPCTCCNKWETPPMAQHQRDERGSGTKNLFTLRSVAGRLTLLATCVIRGRNVVWEMGRQKQQVWSTVGLLSQVKL